MNDENSRYNQRYIKMDTEWQGVLCTQGAYQPPMETYVTHTPRKKKMKIVILWGVSKSDVTHRFLEH